MLFPFVLLFFQKWREQAGASMIAAGATMLGAFFAVADLSIGSQLIPMTSLEWENLAPEPFKTAFGIILMINLFLLFQ